MSAALFRDSLASRALEIAREQHDLLASTPLRMELITVLSRRKFDRYLTMQERSRLVTVLDRECELREPKIRVDACRDRTDNALLAFAIDGRAEVIVTGDRDLLVLNPFRGVSIRTPRAFVEQHER